MPQSISRPIRKRTAYLSTLALVSLAVTSWTSCGGDAGGGTAAAGPGSGGAGSTSGPTTTTGPGSGGGTPVPPSIPPCEASGLGMDYVVGPDAGQLASLDLVPWENLAPGDTVRIHWQATPYKSKFQLSGKGTADKPIRVCGIRGPNGERPVIDGDGATTRATLDYGDAIRQAESIIMINAPGNADWMYFPEYISIDGLEVTAATPSYTFTDTSGQSVAYKTFGACIWIERGQHISLRDDSIHDCTNGVFSVSTDDGDFTLTKDILLESNDIYGNGVEGDDTEHDTYIQSIGVTYELNHYGPLRPGAHGSAITDRSVGTVVRFNRFEECARSIDLVEAEDYPQAAMADPRYRTTYVYGNLITKSADTGTPIHYGGDHDGASPTDDWGEPIFRKGTLYFYDNTVIRGGDAWSMAFLQLATTEEHAEVWNNVFVFTGTVMVPALVITQDVGASWQGGGTFNLGVNWMNSGWVPNDPEHPITGAFMGNANVISGPTAPVDMTTLRPLAGSAIIDVAQAPLPDVANFPDGTEYTSDLAGAQRTQAGAAMDLGALEAQ